MGKRLPDNINNTEQNDGEDAKSRGTYDRLTVKIPFLNYYNHHPALLIIDITNIDLSKRI